MSTNEGRLILRPASTEDSLFAYSVKKAAFEGYVELVWGWVEEDQKRLHGERFAGQDFRVISYAGRDIGILATVQTAECLKLNQLFILPECQGQGIGRRCMSMILAEAEQIGLPIRLGVLKVNPRARQFYEKLGFRLVGESETHDFMEL